MQAVQWEWRRQVGRSFRAVLVLPWCRVVLGGAVSIGFVALPVGVFAVSRGYRSRTWHWVMAVTTFSAVLAWHNGWGGEAWAAVLASILIPWIGGKAARSKFGGGDGSEK